MKIEKAIQVLRDYNLWRRADEDMDQPDPREIGQAIDAAIEAMEELNEWVTLKGWGGTPEIINDFIKGQQSRIYAAQDAEQQRDRLAEAAQAVVDRWETPLWKQVEHTGVYIAALRKAVEEVKGGQP